MTRWQCWTSGIWVVTKLANLVNAGVGFLNITIDLMRTGRASDLMRRNEVLSVDRWLTGFFEDVLDISFGLRRCYDVCVDFVVFFALGYWCLFACLLYSD